MKNKLIAKLKSKLGIRKILTLILLITAVILWANILFSLPQSKTEPVNKEEEIIRNKKEVKELTAPPQFDTEKIYRLKERIRKSPFLVDRKDSEFSYSKKENKEGGEKEVDKEPRLLTEQELYLTGIAEANNNRLAIVKDKNKSYMLKVGSSIHGFKVVKIKEKQVILKKEGQLYKLKSKLKIY